jgi:lipopolysaccharide transport system permease protein
MKIPDGCINFIYPEGFMTKSLPSEMIIGPQAGQKNYFQDLIRYRGLFYFLAWKDILVRYRQAFFGIAWAVVRPLLNMSIFAFLFGKVANFPSEDINYALFVLAAMLPWQLFSNSVIDTCSSLVNNTQLVSKIYFPRIIIPCAQIIVHLLDFTITTCLLLTLAFFMGELSFWTLLSLPLFTLLTLLLCIGSGLWLSALTVQYRDFRIIVPFAMQFGLFISPVGYGTFIIPQPWQFYYFLNPMVGIIDGFRWAFFGISHPSMGMSITFSIAITFGLLISGFYYFRKTERTFADKI